MFEARFGPPKPLDTVCWFHLTRVPSSTTFSEGILPLSEALDKIWNTLLSFLTEPEQRANLEQLKREGVPNHLYIMKTQDPLHFGPHAMLVREVAFHANAMGYSEFLESSEIVEDICDGYQKQFGSSIHEEIRKALKKCIVKVGLPAEGYEYSVEEALLYCWFKIHNQQLTSDANTSYDGKAKAIPSEAIRKVEFLD
jgi:hypothetical protein